MVEKKIKNIAQEYEKTFKNIEEGEVVEGEIVQIDEERGEATISIGFKSEGIIPLEEFVEERKEGALKIKVGDKVRVFLVAKENEEGMVVLSKRQADSLKGWDNITDAYENKKVIEGKVVGEVRGGLKVELEGILGFLPASQVEIGHLKDIRKYVRKVLKLKIIKLDRKERNVILSQRIILEEEYGKKRQELLASLKEGDIREGVVKNLTKFGAFINLGGVDGLLHLNDMSWGRTKRPEEILEVGDKVKTMVLAFDEERGRVSLGLKQTTPNPWTNIEEKHPLNTKVKGEVTSLVPFGAFVKLEEGIEGLIHVNDMSWTRRINYPGKVLSVGEKVEAVVLNIDKENQKISLGLKQMDPDPWLEISEKYKVGSYIKVKVTQIASFGVFVNLEPEIDGLIHISQLSTERISKPEELISVGDEVMAKVIKVNSAEHKISLSIKEYLEDQEKEKVEEYLEKQNKKKTKVKPDNSSEE